MMAPMPDPPTNPRPATRLDLVADCSRCFGLCCVGLEFRASADFAFDKAAGTPCLHLRDDNACGIHGELRERGFRGCTVFDCQGAGQKVSQQTFGGVDWRTSPALAGRMFEAFGIVRALHELLAHLVDAQSRRLPAPLDGRVRQALEEVERLSLLDADGLAGLDLAAHRRDVGHLLGVASRAVRGVEPDSRVDDDLAGADLIGADLRGRALRQVNLRGAYLIGADLRGADLGEADLLGADLRDANLCGADLGGALFATQAQLDAADGDASTVPPPRCTRPRHWPG